jgi:hypothetical protein
LPNPTPAEAARAAAEHAFAEGKAEASGTGGHLGSALAIHDENRAQIGWFIPVLDEARIVGFVQLDDALRFLRYSGFPPEQGYPDAALWIDPERVRLSARQATKAGDVLGEPMLSYHTTPARLAWVVPLHRDAARFTVYVTGALAWTEPCA